MHSSVSAIGRTAQRLAVGAAALVVATVLGSAAYSSIHRSPKPGSAPDVDTVEGRPAESVPGLDFTARDFTIVLAVRSSCVHCEESLPAFRDLLATAQSTGAAVGIAVVSSEPDEVVTRFLKSHGIASVPVYSAPPPSSSMRFVPRLQIVGRDGIVRGDWIGEIDRQRGSEIADALNALARIKT